MKYAALVLLLLVIGLTFLEPSEGYMSKTLDMLNVMMFDTDVR